ncbi:MAG: dTDP-glucose 4,6-dehydratase [Patescibacteria group bacterium]|nr:dTDP-glucose 4,6-dehydratase [Patescibacteria group bacterium]
MRLLVCGGAGFIGSNFIRLMLARYPDYKIINLDLLTYAGNLANLKDVEQRANYKFLRGDINDSKLVESLVKDVDIIINFAAETHVDRSIMDSSAFLRTNVIGTQTLLEAAKKYNRRYHQVSTDEVFGSLGPNDPPFNETTPYDPRSPYSASKAASDHLVRAYFHTYNLPITITNCSNNYGPYQFPEKLHGLFITNLLEGKQVPVYGDGLQRRDWLYVEDHCEAIDLVIHQGKVGETYCVGGEGDRTNMEITNKFLELLGLGEAMVAHVKDRPGHDRRYAINSDKIRRELGWAPRTSFEEGMKKTVEWYKANVDWWKKIKSGEYLKYYEEQYIMR